MKLTFLTSQIVVHIHIRLQMVAAPVMSATVMTAPVVSAPVMTAPVMTTPGLGWIGLKLGERGREGARLGYS